MNDSLNSIEGIALIDTGSLLLIAIAFTYFQWTLIANVLGKSIKIRIMLSIANILIVFSVFGLVVQPKFQYSERNTENELHLYTYSENYSPNLIDELKQSNRYLSAKLFDSLNIKLNKFNGNIRDRQLISEKMISLPKQLLLNPSTDTNRVKLNVLGDGLTPSQAKSLFDNSQLKKIIYQPPKNLLTGLIEPLWSNKINLGDSSYFKAIFQQGVKDNANDFAKDTETDNQFKVSLMTPNNQIVGEQVVSDGDIVQFKITPKIDGLLTYKIAITHKNKILDEDFIFIEVTKQMNSRILILQSSPSFETKQLKNWASDQGATVVVNTNISPKVNLSRLTNVQQKNKMRYNQLTLDESLFDEFDLLVIDPHRFQLLNTKQKKSLKKSIEEGLGIIFLIDRHSVVQSLPLSKISGNELIVKEQIVNRKEVLVYLSQSRSDRINENDLISNLSISIYKDSIKTKQNSEQNVGNSVSALVKDERNNTIVASITLGLGRVGYSLLKDTYRWLSNGEQEVHAQYWQHLIKNIARTKSGIIEWSDKYTFNRGSNDSLISIGEKSDLCFSIKLKEEDDYQSSISSLSDNEAVNILLIKNQLLIDHFCVSYWSKESGWHELKVVDSENVEHSLYFYANIVNSWKANRQKLKIESTIKLQHKVDRNLMSKISVQTQSSRPLNDWVYWLLIVVSLSIIWIEKKYFE